MVKMRGIFWAPCALCQSPFLLARKPATHPPHRLICSFVYSSLLRLGKRIWRRSPPPQPQGLLWLRRQGRSMVSVRQSSYRQLKKHRILAKMSHEFISYDTIRGWKIWLRGFDKSKNPLTSWIWFWIWIFTEGFVDFLLRIGFAKSNPYWYVQKYNVDR